MLVHKVFEKIGVRLDQTSIWFDARLPTNW